MFRSEVYLRLSKIVAIFLFVSLLIMMSLPAQAAGGTISDGPSCSAIGGSWDGGTSTCTLASFLQINAGEVLTIPSGVTFNTVNFINNFGTIENNGTININADKIENNGIFNNNGTFNVNVLGRFWNNHGTFNNTGTININSSIYFLNSSQGLPEAIFYNSGTININTTLTNYNTFYNDCGGVINGTITGDAAIDICIVDSDGDGVVDQADLCPDTILPDPEPTQLKKNRFYASEDGEFIDGEGNLAGISVEDTYGCSGSQIIDAAGLGEGHRRQGITRSALLDWIAAN